MASCEKENVAAPSERAVERAIKRAVQRAGGAQAGAVPAGGAQAGAVPAGGAQAGLEPEGPGGSVGEQLARLEEIASGRAARLDAAGEACASIASSLASTRSDVGEMLEAGVKRPAPGYPP